MAAPINPQKELQQALVGNMFAFLENIADGKFDDNETIRNAITEGMVLFYNFQSAEELHWRQIQRYIENTAAESSYILFLSFIGCMVQI